MRYAIDPVASQTAKKIQLLTKGVETRQAALRLSKRLVRESMFGETVHSAAIERVARKRARQAPCNCDSRVKDSVRVESSEARERRC